MTDNFQLVHTAGELYVYDQNGCMDGTRQLWIYSTFCMPQKVSADLLLSVLIFLRPEDPVPVDGLKVEQVQNCFRICSNCRYLFGYIDKLQKQVGDLESTLGVYPPSDSVSVSPGIYSSGGLFFTRVKNWVHVSPNLPVIKLASIGELKKPDMPSNVRSFSSASGWKRRVSTYLMSNKN